MSRHNHNNSPAQYRSGLYQKSGNDLTGALRDITTSDHPGKWVAGVGLGAMVVAGLAIKAIADLSGKK